MSDKASKSGEKFGVGVAGTGFGRKALMPAIVASTGFELVSVCSASRENATAAAEQFGVAHATEHYRELLDNDEVDVVVVATPPRLHKTMSIDALKAGKHVICEKPISCSVAEAVEMLAVAKEQNLTHVVNHELRYLPSSREFKRLVTDGYIGELRYFDVRACVPLTVNPSAPFAHYSWRDEAESGGGLLSGIFSHYIDMMRFNFGEVAAVHGFATTALASKPYPAGNGPERFGEVGTDDRIAVSGQLESGALFSMAGSWSVHHGAGLRVEAFGDKGTLVLPDPGTLLGGRATDEALTPFALSRQDGDQSAAFGDLLEDLEGVLRGERRAGGFATFEDGLRVQELIDAVRLP
ncbi:MAG: Gfo/Idh/MocA family oxidoreductase [Actinomycetia bacterium]|nr:Gfo/Idh/MocA family oxidoreductase [Actinomycetes bacterium]